MECPHGYVAISLFCQSVYFALLGSKSKSNFEEMAKNSTAVLLKGVVQHYEWGIQGGGSNGVVAQMARSDPEPGKPYAEIWFGTHTAAPALIDGASEDNQDVAAFLRQRCQEPTLIGLFSANPALLGDRTQAMFGCQLPFLLKCLSVAKPLSIQAHPDKRRVHRQNQSMFIRLDIATAVGQGGATFQARTQEARH